MSPLSFLYFLLWLTSAALATGQHRAYNMSMETDPAIGALRLSEGRIERSLISCATFCINSFLVDCRGVMYHHVSRLCTPTGWPSLSEAGPSPDEGHLYTRLQCDRSQGFAPYAYGSAVACLFFSGVIANFTTARSHCQSYNSYIMTIKSRDALHLPALLMPSGGVIFIGLTDEVTEDRFIWEDNGRPIGDDWRLELFKAGEPNDAGGAWSEDCVEFYPFGDPLDANDSPCEDGRQFICERDLIWSHQSGQTILYRK